jgi:hypothetical protein
VRLLNIQSASKETCSTSFCVKSVISCGGFCVGSISEMENELKSMKELSVDIGITGSDVDAAAEVVVV